MRHCSKKRLYLLFLLVLKLLVHGFEVNAPSRQLFPHRVQLALQLRR